MLYPKVLIGAPIHKSKDYCVHEWLKHVCLDTDYPRDRFKVLIVDNSEDKNWHRQFIGLYSNLHVMHFQRSNNQKDWTIQKVLAECQNKIVNFAKRHGFDQLMSNECDNFGPTDMIHRLQKHDLPVVGGFYQHGFGEKRYHMIQNIDAPIFHDPTVIHKTRLMEYEETLPMINGKLHPVANIGIGAMLFQMWVFNYIKFHSDANGIGLSDSYLTADLKNILNLEIYCDTSIDVEHRNDSWGWKKEVELFKGRQMV